MNKNLYLSFIFKFAHKTHKLNRRKHLFESNLKYFSNRKDNNIYNSNINLLNNAIEVVDNQILCRKSEINEILINVKNLYKNHEINHAKIFLDLIFSEMKHSGLDFSQDKMKDLERKIAICIEITEDLSKFDSFSFSQKAPVKIQVAYIRIMDILSKSKDNLEKKDLTHERIMQNAQNVYEEFQKFMNKYNIPQNQKYLSKFSLFYIIIDNFLLVIHGFRLKFILFFSNRSKSFKNSKKFILKAQRIMQKNHSFFSADQKSNILNRINDIESTKEKLIEKSENIIISTSKLMNSFKFGDAENQLISLIDELKKINLPLISEKVENQLDICKINKEFGNKIMDLENIISNQDILGAKSAIVELKHNINSRSNKGKIMSAINMRIQRIELKLTKSNFGNVQSSINAKVGNRSKPVKKDYGAPLFNHFKEIILRENEIEKKKLAKLLKINEDDLFERMLVWKEKIPFELENGIIILKIQEPKKRNTNPNRSRSKKTRKKSQKKKENSVIEDLDDLMNTDFNQE